MADFQYAKELEHPFFKSPHVATYELDEDSIFVSGLPFWQEQLFYTRGRGEMPWHTDPARACQRMAKQWKNIAQELDASFKLRETPDMAIIRDGVGIYLSMLFWSNRRPVQLDNLEAHMETLEVIPMNLEERLAFVMERPDGYPAFKQLNELVKEQRKLVLKTTY
ncbi:hypothetical protein HCA55_00405 [Listeria booriae]|uniref:YpoC-like domain-containing protein n=1 Tax=Listeria booriae TaxID=1552123 RepID=A0A099W6I9_9LIST|nr:hypothetical protein [Listeria booriae]KGL40597.1 hypothetical protein EP57_08560 [Listeria booriae]MBC1357284.1 hypothetical protein [Listeria booriae]MBC1373027.1 hypothetical protein [Listeria booriae]MBC1553298.1 hypothetical protein [Listeria booriae]MBC1557650.1 hypothetical protein [Listeria booriae]